jgi:hypothetical protein
VGEVVEEAEVEAEVEEEEEQQQEEQQQQEEEMRNSLEQNHLPLTGIDKTSTDSSQTFKGTCP